jgi:hypothetical protein
MADIRDLFRQFRDLGPTDDVVESGIHCYRRPNRTEERHFSANDAARIMCYAVRGGSSEAEIVARFRRVCDDEGRSRPDRVAEAAAVAVQALELTNATLLDEWRAFLVVNGVLLGVIALLGVIQIAGPLRLVAQPLRLGARVAQTQVAQLITLNITRRAANDAAMEVVREALRRAA